MHTYILLMWLDSYSPPNMHTCMQVMSDSVSKAIELTGGPDAQETARFVAIFDKFFDCLNVNDYNTGCRKRKVFKQPYQSGTDFRLEVSFYQFLPKWLITLH